MSKILDNENIDYIKLFNKRKKVFLFFRFFGNFEIILLPLLSLLFIFLSLNELISNKANNIAFIILLFFLFLPKIIIYCTFRCPKCDALLSIRRHRIFDFTLKIYWPQYCQTCGQILREELKSETKLIRLKKDKCPFCTETLENETVCPNCGKI